MNYRHLYHAGNFADVFKHCILLMLVETLCQKEKPFCYLDTHAGTALYDLTSEIAQKTHEYLNGISRIYNQTSELTTIKTYQKIVAEVNSHNLQNITPLKFYPGSPAIVHTMLRAQDSMVLVELHPEDATELKQYFAYDNRVAVHHTDGYQSLKAFLPPKKGRGLILIDPPFEQPDEFQQIVIALKTALQRYPIGIYCIWYPIKDVTQIKKFHQELQKLKCKNLLITKIAISKNIAANTENNSLTSCSMAIINAPWQFQQQLDPIISWLDKNLAQDSASFYKIDWLKA